MNASLICTKQRQSDPPLPGGPLFPLMLNCWKPKQHSAPKGKMPESEKEAKEIVPGKGDMNGQQVPGVSLSVNKHVKSLLLEYAESHGNCRIFFFFALTSFLPVGPWLIELSHWWGEVVPSKSYSTAGLRSHIPRSDRRGCTGRWPWVACPLSSADAMLSAWRSGDDSSDRKSGRAAWGQCWRTPRAQSVMLGCSVPHTWPEAPSGERREVVTIWRCQTPARLHSLLWKDLTLCQFLLD